MKNKELYESIERLVNGKESKHKSSLSEAQEYCRKEIKKKKLTPKNPGVRIDELLENFTSIKTYINVKDLIGCVNEAYRAREEQNGRESFAQSHLPKTIIKDENDIDTEILFKASKILRRGYQREFKKENEAMDTFVDQLEKNSFHLSESTKNTHENLLRQNEEAEIKKIKLEGKMGKKKWNHYSYKSNFIQTEPSQITPKFTEPLSSILAEQKKKEKDKLFELAQIYLQMILENEYKKKWNKSYRTELAEYQFHNKPNNFCTPKTFKTESTQSFHRSRFSEAKKFSKGKSVYLNKENGTALGESKIRRFSRNPPKIREIAMRKVNNFLADLEENELTLKNEKKSHLRSLSRLEKQIDDEGSILRDGSIWKDDEKCMEIQKALHRQSSVMRSVN